MTLGAAPEALAIGFLRNQRLVESIEQIVAVQVDWEVNAVAVTTRDGLVDLERKTEKRTATTGCGQGTVFGDLMADIESIQPRRPHARGRGDALRAAERRAPARIDLQAGRRRARLRARAKARRSSPSSRMWAATTRSMRSPGWMWLEGVDGADKIFYTTGRLTSEMVIKAAQMGIPVLVSRSGLTKMGHEVATAGRHHDDRTRGRTSTTSFSRAPNASCERRRPMPETGTARCHCGGVEIQVTFPSRFCCHCYCRSCRTTHASGVVTWIGFNRSQVTLHEGRRTAARLRIVTRDDAQVLLALRHAHGLRIDPQQLEGRGAPAALAFRHTRGPRALAQRLRRGAARVVAAA